mmetsp:Transcript_32542/g.74881  ORF Transcript_32542/g.74881 Transcript_32542/m.74881 type:complete len:401 (-) Transcript_32542:105-1307(-)
MASIISPLGRLFSSRKNEHSVTYSTSSIQIWRIVIATIILSRKTFQSVESFSLVGFHQTNTARKLQRFSKGGAKFTNAAFHNRMSIAFNHINQRVTKIRTMSTSHLIYSQTNDMSKHEIEFMDMIERFVSHSQDEVETLMPKHQALFHGVSAALNDEKPVLRAFVVLYEDLGPVRTVGRFIFNYLEQIFAKSVRERREENERFVDSTGFTEETINLSRKFHYILCHDDERKRLLDDLAKGCFLEESEVFTSIDIFDEEFMNRLEEGPMPLNSLLVSLKKTEIPEEKIAGVLVLLLASQENRPMDIEKSASVKSQKYIIRYNNMLKKFADWEPLFTGDGEELSRQREILRGCFVGAKNAAVVEALRIVYTDYTALRFAGDLIFKLVSEVVRSSKKTNRTLN